MTNTEMLETVNAMTALAEDLTKVTDTLRAVSVRNDVRGFYDHLTTSIEVPDGEGTRILDPETDRDVVIPNTRFTLGEVLDWSFTLAKLMEFIEANPGTSVEAPGVLRRAFGFSTPTSHV